MKSYTLRTDTFTLNFNLHFRSFEWTTIQLNLNYLSTLHVDRSNLGASYIIGFDDYEGGELYIYEQGTVCCKGRFVPFDGNTPHMTCAFTGTRYTCIFFVDPGDV